MAYQVPASKRSIKQNQFEFEIEGKAYSLPRFDLIPISVLEKIEEAPMNAVSPYLEVFGPKTSPLGKAIRSLDKEQLTGLLTAWQEDAGITAGESAAS